MDPALDIAYEVVFVDVDELRPHPRNYQTHPDDQIAHIMRSIELHGFYRNVVVARDMTLLAGHGVTEAARRLGRQRIPVVMLDVEPFDVRALQVLAGDNEMSNLAAVDDRALTELLRELAAIDLDNLLGTGFDDQMLAALTLVTRPASEIADLAAAGEWLGLPGFEATDKLPQITVKFDNTDDRDRFAEQMSLTYINHRVGEMWTVWWPERERDDRAAVRFE